MERSQHVLDVPEESAPPAGLYRVVSDEGDGRTWLMTADYRRLAPFKWAAVEPQPGLVSGRLRGGTSLVNVLRVGQGSMLWRKPGA